MKKLILTLTFLCYISASSGIGISNNRIQNYKSNTHLTQKAIAESKVSFLGSDLKENLSVLPSDVCVEEGTFNKKNASFADLIGNVISDFICLMAEKLVALLK